MKIDSFPDRHIIYKGETYLYFGGTSYLGMATNAHFLKLLSNNLIKWGSHYGSSRQANVTLSIYGLAEKMLAQNLGAEQALTASSGTLAGNLVVDTLAKAGPLFYHIEKTHPAILASDSKPVYQGEKLDPRLQDKVIEDVVICTDAILSLEVSPTSFDFLNLISKSKRITLLVDESHSLGIVGPKGQGVLRLIPKESLSRLIRISSLGKAYGLAGGFIVTDALFIELIRNEATFISASGANPAYLATFIEAQELFEMQAKKLKSNLDFVAKNLQKHTDLKFNGAYPVIYSNNDAIFTTLLEHKMVITKFNYPTYKKPMNRIVITANHTQSDLQQLIHILNTYDK